MEVKVGNLLSCGLTDGVPHTNALTRKSIRNSTGDISNCGHEGRTGFSVEISNILKMRSRHYQYVARMELADIHECNGQ